MRHNLFQQINNAKKIVIGIGKSWYESHTVKSLGAFAVIIMISYGPGTPETKTAIVFLFGHILLERLDKHYNVFCGYGDLIFMRPANFFNR